MSYLADLQTDQCIPEPDQPTSCVGCLTSTGGQLLLTWQSTPGLGYLLSDAQETGEQQWNTGDFSSQSWPKGAGQLTTCGQGKGGLAYVYTVYGGGFNWMVEQPSTGAGNLTSWSKKSYVLYTGSRIADGFFSYIDSPPPSFRDSSGRMHVICLVQATNYPNPDTYGLADVWEDGNGSFSQADIPITSGSIGAVLGFSVQYFDTNGSAAGGWDVCVLWSAPNASTANLTFLTCADPYNSPGDYDSSSAVTGVNTGCVLGGGYSYNTSSAQFPPAPITGSPVGAVHWNNLTIWPVSDGGNTVNFWTWDGSKAPVKQGSVNLSSQCGGKTIYNMQCMPWWSDQTLMRMAVVAGSSVSSPAQVAVMVEMTAEDTFTSLNVQVISSTLAVANNMASAPVWITNNQDQLVVLYVASDQQLHEIVYMQAGVNGAPQTSQWVDVGLGQAFQSTQLYCAYAVNNALQDIAMVALQPNVNLIQYVVTSDQTLGVFDVIGVDIIINDATDTQVTVKPVPYNTYRTIARVVDSAGMPAAGLPCLVWAGSADLRQVNGVYYHLPSSQETAFTINTNVQGELVFDEQTEYLSTDKVYVLPPAGTTSDPSTSTTGTTVSQYFGSASRVADSDLCTIEPSGDTCATLNDIVNSGNFASSTDQNGNSFFAGLSNQTITAVQDASQDILGEFADELNARGAPHSAHHRALQAKLATTKQASASNAPSGSRLPRPKSWRLWATPRPVASGAKVQQLDPSIRANGSHLQLEEFDLSYEVLTPAQAEQHVRHTQSTCTVLNMEESRAMLRRETRKREEWILQLEQHPKLSKEQLHDLQRRVAQTQRYRVMRGHRPDSDTGSSGSNGFFSWLADICDSIISGVSTFVEWAVNAGVTTLTAIINGVTYAMEVIVDTVEAAVRSVQAVFAWIKKAIADFIAWIGFLFNWGDIQYVAQAITNALAPSSSAASSLFTSINTWMAANLQGIVTQGDSAGSMAQGGLGLQGQLGSQSVQGGNQSLSQYEADNPAVPPASGDPAVPALSTESYSNSPQDVGRQHLSNYAQNQVAVAALCFCASSVGVRARVSATGQLVPPRMCPVPKHRLVACVTHHRNEPLPVCSRCNKPRSFYRKRIIVPKHMQDALKAHNSQWELDMAALKTTRAADDWDAILESLSDQTDTIGGDSATQGLATPLEGATNSTTFATQPNSAVISPLTASLAAGGIGGKLLDWIMGLMNGLQGALADGVSWMLTAAGQGIYIPVLSEIVKLTLGISLSVSNIVGVVVAIPATIAVKLITGSAPLGSDSDVTGFGTLYSGLFNKFVSSSSSSSQSKVGADPVWAGTGYIAAVIAVISAGIGQVCTGMLSLYNYIKQFGLPDRSAIDTVLRVGETICELLGDIFAMPWLYKSPDGHLPSLQLDKWEGLAVFQWIIISCQSGLDCILTAGYLAGNYGWVKTSKLCDTLQSVVALVFGAGECCISGLIISSAVNAKPNNLYYGSAPLLAVANFFNGVSNIIRGVMGFFENSNPAWCLVAYIIQADLNIASSIIEVVLVGVAPPSSPSAVRAASGPEARRRALSCCKHCGSQLGRGVMVAPSTALSGTAVRSGGSKQLSSSRVAVGDATVALSYRPRLTGDGVQQRQPALVSRSRPASTSSPSASRTGPSSSPIRLSDAAVVSARNAVQPSINAGGTRVDSSQQARQTVHSRDCFCRQCGVARRSSKVVAWC